MSVPKILLAFKMDAKTYLSQVAEGIAAYARETLSLEFVLLLPWMQSPDSQWIERSFENCDGIITGVRPESNERLAATQKPMVTVGPEALLLPHPWVGPDYKQMAETACRKFSESGFRSMLYVHSEDPFAPHSLILKESLEIAAIKRGLKLITYSRDLDYRNIPSTFTLEDQLEDLKTFCKTLPLPCGAFTFDDDRAWRINEACKRAGLKVPEDVSILGIRSHDYICEFSSPPLSHIFIDYQQIGYRAAELMMAQLNGIEIPERTLIRDQEIRERGSSHISVHREPVVEKSIAYMEEHLHERIQLENIATAAYVSKSTLSRRFQNILGKSPREVLRELRCNHALDLLSNTSLPLIEVAEKSGIGEQSQLNRLIKNRTGRTPGQIRNAYRF